jgi:hypothetical protein
VQSGIERLVIEKIGSWEEVATWSRSWTDIIAGTGWVEIIGAGEAQVGCDVAVRRHSLLKQKGDVEVGRWVESYVTEASGRLRRQLL